MFYVVGTGRCYYDCENGHRVKPSLKSLVTRVNVTISEKQKKNRKIDTTRTSDRQIKETYIEIGIKKDRKYRKIESIER